MEATIGSPLLAMLAMTIACGPAFAQPSGARPDDAEIRSRLDRDVPRLLAESRVPSVSIAHVRDGKVAWTTAYGTQSADVPATPDTLYNIASMTKPVSAEVILRLASEGRLSLDEPMSPHWTDPDIAGDERHKKLTPRLALSHQTGFPNWRGQTGDILKFQRSPGEAFGYSGEGYEYVARFAEKKTGARFEDLARTLVFEPAGMKDTSYTGRPWFEGRIAVPADADGKPLTPKVSDTYSASDDLYTTAGDYARFMASVMNRDGVNDAIARERASIQVKMANDQDSPAGFQHGMGLGWEVFRLGDETFLMHSGSDPGEYTFGYFSPTNRTGTVIFTSGVNGEKMLLPILDRVGVDEALLKMMHAHLD